MLRTFYSMLCLAFVPFSVFAQEQDWNFVQALGGIKVDSPTRTQGGWILPVHVDVSGLKAITHTPSRLNSMLACIETRVTVEKRSIHVAIVTGTPSQKHSSHCPYAHLGAMEPGSYTVFYRNPDGTQHRIREIWIEP